MGEFSSRWLNWAPETASETSDPERDARDALPDAIPPMSRTDKTDKSTSVSFVSSMTRGIEPVETPIEASQAASQRAPNYLPMREDRFVWFRSRPYPGEDDKADVVDGHCVVGAIRERGGDLTIQGEHIVLRYFANMPDLSEINDWIRTNRIGVVAALTAQAAGA